MSKLRHIAVVSVFGLTGMSFMLNVLRVLLHLKTVSGPYFKTELDFLEGTAFLITAVGLIHFDAKSRSFAIFLSTMYLALAAVSLASLIATSTAFTSLVGLFTLLWTIVWVLVLWWLLSTPARAEIAALAGQSRTV